MAVGAAAIAVVAGVAVYLERPEWLGLETPPADQAALPVEDAPKAPANDGTVAALPDTDTQAGTPADTTAPKVADDSVESAEPAQDATAPEADEAVTDTAEDASDPIRPGFDVVRVDPEGGAVVAGSAPAGAMVDVILDGQVVAQAQADSTGRFVALFDAGTSAAPQIMSLLSDPGGEAVASEQTVVIAARTPEPEPAPIPETVITEVTSDTTAEPEIVITDVTSEASDQPEIVITDVTSEASDQPEIVITEVTSNATPAQPQEPTAPTVLLADQTGITVLQDQAPDVRDTVLLDTITYEQAGEVTLAGRGAGDGFVRVYLDNRPIKTSAIEADGSWRADLPDVDTGIYTLRIDQIDGEGAVTSRVETPFKREAEEVIEAAKAAAKETPTAPVESTAVVADAGPTDGGAEPTISTQESPVQLSVVTVQPGSTLWAIARERYGEGILYVRVFEANQDRIRDPDLIYPGQIFNLPE